MTTTPKGSRFCSVHGYSSPGIKRYGRNVAAMLVDGVEVALNRCYAASEPNGFVDCYKLKNGEPFVLPGTDDVARERLTGAVQIRLKGEAP